MPVPMSVRPPDHILALFANVSTRITNTTTTRHTTPEIIFNMIKQGQINTALDYMKLMKSSGLQPTLNVYAYLFNVRIFL